MDLEMQLKDLRHQLDVATGAQMAMLVALRALLEPYKGNPLAIAALSIGLEHAHAGMLNSQSSDAKIQAFLEIREALLAELA